MPVGNPIVLRPAVTAVAVAILLSACDRHNDREASAHVAEIAAADRPLGRSGARVTPASASAPYGTPTFSSGADGSVSIQTRDRHLVMSLRHDSVVVAFSDSVRESVSSNVRQKMHKDSVPGSALGQVLHGVVQSTVSGALHEVFEKARGFPLSAVRSVAYEGGAIRFEFVEEPTWNFDGFETDGEPIMAQFHPADAARFVGAVRGQLKQQ